MKPTDIYLFSGTHWDREWYQTFQGFRSRLVKMIDELIDYIEKEPEFETYHFDGQTIVLEDYKEIAPENEDRLKKLISDGRIKIGPWYDMPDEFILSGESLIRNLLTGTRLAKKWGSDPWLFGYVCDIFGHIAQTPQIFNGFGIKHSILGRGTNETDPAYFAWQAPDGSECMTYNLNPKDGYGNFCASVVFKSDEETSDEELKAIIKEYAETEIERSNTPVLIFMDALDHQRIHKNTPKYIKILKELYPDVNIHHCDLREAGKQLEAIRDSLPTKKGELNKTVINKVGYLHLITNTLSSYYTHKQANDDCQNALEKVVEPLTAYLALDNRPVRRSYINLAYKNLLQNHPHDSICGCSIDQVHKDMVYRFDQVKEIAQDITENFLFEDKPAAGNSDNYILKLYNPLAFDRHECVTAEVVLDKDFPTKYAEPFDYEFIASFKIIDINGNEVPYQVVDMTKNYIKRIAGEYMTEGESYIVSFMADIPACGYTEYKIVPYERPSRYLEKMISGSNFAENDFISMEINSDGEITVYDKKTGKIYENLCSFIDDGEIGDGWYHSNPVSDKVVYSHGTGAVIEKIENGPSRCVFRIMKELTLPECVEDGLRGKKRSDRYVKMPVVIEAGLSENARFVDINMTVSNNVKDHRLRLALPTGIYEDTYFAGQAFYCNERKTGIDYNSQNYREHEQYEKQMNGIVGKRDADGDGIAFVSASGLHECGSFDGDLICVTLLRAFKTTVRTMGETAGQLQGDLHYSFLLAPVDNDVNYSELVKLQDRLAVKPLSSVTKVSEDYVQATDSFMKIDGKNITLSIVKNPEEAEENAIIVRVYNSSADNAEGNITFKNAISKAYAVNLNEEVIAEVPAEVNEIKVSLTPWKIATYKIVF